MSCEVYYTLYGNFVNRLETIYSLSAQFVEKEKPIPITIGCNTVRQQGTLASTAIISTNRNGCLGIVSRVTYTKKEVALPPTRTITIIENK